MTDQYRWTSHKPLARDDLVEQGDVFEPTDAELQAFGDLLEPVEDEGAETLPFDPESKTIAELEGDLEDVDDEETLKALRNLEQDQKDREGAVDAIEARLEEV